MELPSSASQAMYDEKDRELIRRRLRAHMARFKMGVPALQGKVTEAAGRTPDQLPLSTLQRFVAAKVRKDKIEREGKAKQPMRTNDAVVWMCHKFLLEVNEPDPVSEFGDAACRFYQHDADQKQLPELAGSFAVDQLAGPTKEEPRGSMRNSYSTLVVEQVPHAPFLRVEETIEDRTLSAALSRREHEYHAEGVALRQGGALMVLLRDALTRQTKSYVFSAAPDEETGEHDGMVTAPFFDGVFIAASRSSNIAVKREQEGSA